MKTTKIYIAVISILGVATTSHARRAGAEPIMNGKLEVHAMEAQEYSYTGRPFDAKSGGYVFAFRSYDPTTARWSSIDPSGFPDGSNNSAYRPTPTNSLDFAGLMAITWTTRDAVTRGTISAEVEKDTSGIVKAQQSGHCWVAVTANAFKFSGTGTIQLPEVGKTFTDSGNTGVFDATFHGTTTTHEGWHKTHLNHAADKSYTALETWSSSYTSNLFKTKAAALSAGRTDFSNALTKARSVFSDFYGRTQDHEGATSPTGSYFDAAAGTWRSANPDWGGPFDATITAYTINFTKVPATCE